ncbi:MAG: Rod shape-determining protein MreD [uncultured Thiotrichaceae bacterium]|uniref:Rod shape-determining protein MreD n=1 Tax=uncultured Thiotrichaceae bacterium TaxID=298394 RepID=A0A6S6SGJ9_9GAMM|nr:MAG: Rod shape-determining protein MreD [uncultured Thiotrichaceae bacterium]
MENLSLKFSGAILLSLLGAFVLTLAPVNGVFGLWRPEWLVLVIIHWAIYFPDRISYVLVGFLGLMLDAAWQLSLGQHSLSFVVLLYVVIRLSERLSPNSLLQHLFMVLVATSVYMLTNLWVLTATDNNPANWGYWYPVFTSLLIWPFVTGLLKRMHMENQGR